jgi:hypothetical protein
LRPYSGVDVEAKRPQAPFGSLMWVTL